MCIRDSLRPGHDGLLFDVITAYVAEAARNHDGLVIAAQRRALGHLDALFEGAEVAEDVRAAEFVVERRRTDRAVEHDLERGRDAVRASERLFPGLLGTRNTQVRDGIACLLYTSDA